ncbi:AraC family transcriptional regulator [Flammeovirga sp. EKP202]|uniref:helix-turn-helix domain-containing protein n=1 Tax=Flammeovirga sp. EKP202 TaxID=2770592 RepID=UPI00166006AC|nr:helix-turn-helix domain-containing protein [Flammeovirga sp. EKP202]MBD0400852.1 AraC family transcriptional regulator [Flammeovirga sp. EKP202]
MEENILEIRTDETNPNSSYDLIEKEFGGVVNGNHLMLDSEKFGVIDMTYYEYFPRMFCGVTNLNLKVPIRVLNQTGKKEHFVSIRIGKSGDFTSETKKKSTLLNSLYVYNSNQEFYIDYSINQPIRWYYMRIPVQMIDKFIYSSDHKLNELIHKKEAWFYYDTLTPEYDKIISELDFYMQDPVVKKGMLLSKMIEVLSILQKKSFEDGLENVVYGVHKNDLNLMFQLKDDILSDFKEVPDLKKLMKKYGMSESKLQKTFKKVYKKPILQFFNHHRLEEAKHMITHTDKDLSQISVELGYTDLTHFSKRYYAKFGERPSVTRKSQQKIH